MSWRRILLALVLAAIALYLYFALVLPIYRMQSITSHRGDGTFENISGWYGPFAIPGYSISMPEFDLANPQHGKYRFAILPNTGGKCGVYLALHDPDRRLWDTRGLGGRLKFELLDSLGNVVVSVSGRLGAFTWFGFRHTWALYSDESFFNSDSGEEYQLHFHYEPDPLLAGYKGFVYVRSVGK